MRQAEDRSDNPREFFPIERIVLAAFTMVFSRARASTRVAIWFLALAGAASVASAAPTQPASSKPAAAKAPASPKPASPTAPVAPAKPPSVISITAAAQPAPEVKPVANGLVSRTRSFVVEMHSGDTNSVRLVDLVASFDPAHPLAPIKVEIRLSKIGKPVEQTIAFTSEASVEAVLASADDVDFNFDGYRDFWVVREMGAKWARYEAFVFESKKGQFVKDGLSREIGALDSPEVDEVSKTIVSGSIGPSEPYRTVHKVSGGHMVITESCVFHNGHDGARTDTNDGMLTIQKVVQGALKTVTQKQISVAFTDNPCNGQPVP